MDKAILVELSEDAQNRAVDRKKNMTIAMSMVKFSPYA